MNKFFSIFGWVFGWLCILSALLQYNDPDPLMWMVIYGIMALVSFAFAMGRLSFFLPLVLGILGIAGFIYFFPEKFEGFRIGSGDIKNIEEGREAFGLLILAGVMFLYAFRIRASR
ncbi:MAG: transmembrane 220 family protein [Bacteroidota bacterium]